MGKNQKAASVLIGLAGLLALAVLSMPYYIVNPGETALHLRLGEVIKSNTESGFYFKIPVVNNIVFINNRICKSEIETSALSKDLQSVQIGIAINYKIDDALLLYKTIGTDFDKVIINPFTQESMKSVVAQFTAEDLIQFRHRAKEKVFTELKERLKPQYITLIDFNIIHSEFSVDFIKAVEEKQIAEQSAKQQKI